MNTLQRINPKTIALKQADHSEAIPTTRTKLFARWVMQDGKLVCQWIAE
jgi:hypothetical protein